MCRNIRPLFNYDPPVTKEEVRDAALQFVRKVSGYQEPSEVNKKVFDTAVNEITESVDKLIQGLVTSSKKRNREEEIAKARELSKKRFG